MIYAFRLLARYLCHHDLLFDQSISLLRLPRHANNHLNTRYLHTLR